MPSQTVTREIVPRPSRMATPIQLKLTRPQRLFLLYRLSDIADTTDAIVDNPPTGQMTSPWTRAQIINRAASLVTALRDGRELLLVGEAVKAILVEAIEGNLYFAQMEADDPRRNEAAIAQADALRKLLQRVLARPIRPIPLTVPKLKKKL